ncbi:MAG: biotin synthase [Rubrivivax sp.]|nr:biotin synthase [Rubrivivax sp.]MDP3084968.1 biotin synthase [Rubrivivax sp.]
MPDTSAERSARRPVDPVALQHVQQRLARAATPPWLHGEVARRMAERLPVIRLQPDRVIDWGSQLGASRELLAAAYPRALRLLVEADAGQRALTEQALTRPWWSPQRWAQPASAAHTPDSLTAGAGELLWANMALHGAADPQAMMAQWHRALAADGFLMFSTLGPGTLQTLQTLYRAQGWAPPFAPFVDMHDLGDMLVQAGFADPVMDQEQITLTWADADGLLAELRGLGGNADPRRHAGLRTPRWRQALDKLLMQTAGADGRPALGFEIVYGHAFRPPPRPRLAERTEVPLDDMRAMVRAGRRPA